MSFIKVILILALVFAIQTSAQYYSRPYRYGYENTQPMSDPYGNLGTHSTWQDSIVLHLFG